MSESQVCLQKTGSGWARNTCRKPVFETIDGNPLCKMHAKKYRIRHHMDTGEVLDTKFLVYSGAIYKCEGVSTLKVFTIRKSEMVFGKAWMFQTRIDIDDKGLCATFEDAKKLLAEIIRENIRQHHRSIDLAEEKLKKLEAA